jgi:methanethiol S-methyltransferase
LARLASPAVSAAKQFFAASKAFAERGRLNASALSGLVHAADVISDSGSSAMKRSSFALFGLFAYSMFTATFLYLVLFVAGLPIVPRSIDGPVTGASTAMALVIDILLVAIFGLQHTVMARAGFKQAWTKLMPKPIERSGYLIFSCAVLALMFACWQPIPAVVWDTRGTFGEPLLWGLSALGWLICLTSTYLINHFELFGLKQVWDHWRGHTQAAPVFRQPFLYKLVRHPLYTGFLLAFWAAPMMTVGHLVYAAAMTVYVYIAVAFEERDLQRMFGDDYRAYQQKVGKLSPRLARQR